MSTDGGAVWNDNLPYYYEYDCGFLLCQNVPGLLLFGGMNGSFSIIRSTDYGETSEPVLDVFPNYITTIEQDPHDPSHLLATGVSYSTTTFYHSSDYGATWTESPYALSAKVNDIHFSPTTPYRYICATDQGIYVTDNGQDYTQTETTEVLNFEYSPDRQTELYAACAEAGIKKSTDDGATWEPLPAIYRDNTQILSLEIVGNIYLYAGTEHYGIFRTELEPTGIEEEEEPPATSTPPVTPHTTPARGAVTLIINPTDHHSSLAVYDITGRTVHTQVLPPAETVRNITVEGLAPGVYFTGLVDGGEFERFVMVGR